jgi:hypothetical protein
VRREEREKFEFLYIKFVFGLCVLWSAHLRVPSQNCTFLPLMAHQRVRKENRRPHAHSLSLVLLLGSALERSEISERWVPFVLNRTAAMPPLSGHLIDVGVSKADPLCLQLEVSLHPSAKPRRNFNVFELIIVIVPSSILLSKGDSQTTAAVLLRWTRALVFMSPRGSLQGMTPIADPLLQLPGGTGNFPRLARALLVQRAQWNGGCNCWWQQWLKPWR